MADISVKVDAERDLTTFTVKGDITLNDILSYSSENYLKHTTKNVIWDAVQGSVQNIDPDQAKSIAHEMRLYTRQRRGGKTAFIPNEKDLDIARLYEMIARDENLPVTYKTFTNADDALDWLFPELNKTA